MTGSVVPSSSIRLRMTSIDWATSDDMRCSMPSGVSSMAIRPPELSPKVSSGMPPATKLVPPSWFCRVCRAVLAASFCVGSVSSISMPVSIVVMILPIPFSLASIERASRRRSLIRSLTISSRLTCNSRCEPPCRSRPSVTCWFGNQSGIAARQSVGSTLGSAKRKPTSETMTTIAVRKGEKCI